MIKRSTVFIYSFVKSALELQFSTAGPKKEFYLMKVRVNRLCNPVGDKWMNNCVVTYIEKNVIDAIMKPS